MEWYTGSPGLYSPLPVARKYPFPGTLHTVGSGFHPGKIGFRYAVSAALSAATENASGAAEDAEVDVEEEGVVDDDEGAGGVPIVAVMQCEDSVW